VQSPLRRSLLRVAPFAALFAIAQAAPGPNVVFVTLLGHYIAGVPGALTAMLNYYRALIRGLRRNRRRGIARIDIPTLMIWGEVDAALGKELTYGTDQFVSNLTLRYLPNVSHWVQQEAPETVNAMIEAWLLDRSVPYAPGAKPSTVNGGS